jgi:uncharacterized membrane protein
MFIDEMAMKMVIDSLDRNTSAISELKSSVDKNMVGRDNCDMNRERCNDRLKPIEEACLVFKEARGGFIDKSDLQDAITVSLAPILTRLQTIEDDRRVILGLVPTVKKIAFGVFGGGYIAGLSAIGIYWERVGQYGWHIVALVLVSIILVSIVFWLGRQNNRNTTKNATKKWLLGLQ